MKYKTTKDLSKKVLALNMFSTFFFSFLSQLIYRVLALHAFEIHLYASA